MGSGSVTVDSVLAQANGSYQLALAQIVEERNTIQGQNSMLWKRIEKIKDTAAGLKKDLDRVRGERDQAVQRLRQVTGEDSRSRPTAQRNHSIDTASPSERPAVPVRHMSDTGQSNISCPISRELSIRFNLSKT